MDFSAFLFLEHWCLGMTFHAFFFLSEYNTSPPPPPAPPYTLFRWTISELPCFFSQSALPGQHDFLFLSPSSEARWKGRAEDSVGSSPFCFWATPASPLVPSFRSGKVKELFFLFNARRFTLCRPFRELGGVGAYTSASFSPPSVVMKSSSFPFASDFEGDDPSLLSTLPHATGSARRVLRIRFSVPLMPLALLLS